MFRMRHRLSLMHIFPPEILLDILTRLPVKCIGRCRCVSKSWCHILSEPDFIKAHLARTKQCLDDELLMLKSRRSKTLFCGTIDRQLLGEITVLATELTFFASPTCWFGGTTCDGLILLLERDKCKSLLVNPTTQEVRELCAPSHDLDSYTRDTIYGLGYDQVNDDYKVVTLSCYHTEDEPTMLANVYSVRNGSWKQVENCPYFLVTTLGVFVGGSIHWIAISHSYSSDYSHFIVGFDLIEEKFWKVPAPSSVFCESYEHDNLAVVGECLCMFSYFSEKEISIWVMKEYGVMKSWTKFSIVDEQGSELMPYLGLRGQQELVIRKDEHTPDVRFSIYNLGTATFQDMTVQGINDGFNLVGSFKETLVSPYYSHSSKRG